MPIELDDKELLKWMYELSNAIDNIEKLIGKAPDDKDFVNFRGDIRQDHQKVLSDLTEIKTKLPDIIIKLTSIMENHTSHITKLQSIHHDINQLGPTVSIGNKHKLERLEAIICSDESTMMRNIKIVKDFIDIVNKEVNDIMSICERDQIKVQPEDIIDIITFAKRGNTILNVLKKYWIVIITILSAYIFMDKIGGFIISGVSSFIKSHSS